MSHLPRQRRPRQGRRCLLDVRALSVRAMAHEGVHASGARTGRLNKETNEKAMDVQRFLNKEMKRSNIAGNELSKVVNRPPVSRSRAIRRTSYAEPVAVAGLARAVLNAA